MPGDLTPAVARALEAARLWAVRLGAAEVEPTHFLYALLAEEEGRAALLLAEAGLDPARAIPPVADRTPLGPASGMALNQVSAAILTAAQDLAEELSGETTIASEHLLLALLRRDEPLRRRLESLGMAWTEVEQAATRAQAPRLRLDAPLDLPEPQEQIAAGRILDANANRAREALRVVEDYCRFVLDDAFLSRQLKQLRHDLVEALETLPVNLLTARDTPGDVGTRIATEHEQHRHSLGAVVRANLKRLQEAMRSLEEFGKVASPALGRTLEQLRYRVYTLEQAILTGSEARRRLVDARLYVLLSGSGCSAALDWTLREAASGGAQIVQLREKNLSDRALLDRARQVRRWTREAGVLFIVNDRPDIARLAEADGVHVGQDDLSVRGARRVFGPDALIGVSTHDLDQVRRAVLDGASYLGVGPTFPSGTKEFPEYPGLDFVRQVAAETSLPAFVLGGVTPDNVGAVLAAGARRVAVSQAICQADEPRAVAAALRRLLDSH
jgi:thiamine-phosphate pyrophosphorylase